MEINFSPDNLKELATLLAPMVTVKRADPDWAKLKDIRQDLFAGKPPAWIRLFIFDAFPEIQIENGHKGAWVKGVHGQGSVTKVYLPYARKWMHEHHDEFDWTAKMP